MCKQRNITICVDTFIPLSLSLSLSLSLYLSLSLSLHTYTHIYLRIDLDVCSVILLLAEFLSQIFTI